MREQYMERTPCVKRGLRMSEQARGPLARVAPWVIVVAVQSTCARIAALQAPQPVCIIARSTADLFYVHELLRCLNCRHQCASGLPTLRASLVLLTPHHFPHLHALLSLLVPSSSVVVP